MDLASAQQQACLRALHLLAQQDAAALGLIPPLTSTTTSVAPGPTNPPAGIEVLDLGYASSRQAADGCIAKVGQAFSRQADVAA